MIFEQKWLGARITENGEEVFVASVPGNIQNDYAKAKGFRDVMYGDGCRQFEPLEGDEWEYRARLDYRTEENERVFFVSRGIDYRYRIDLNGRAVYEHEGVFKPVEVDLTGLLRGDDTLCVHIFPHPKRAGAKKGTRDEADRSCKPPVCYGWDWNPRLLISGMWREAYIETRKPGYIRNAEAFYTLSPGLDSAEVRFDVDCEYPCKIRLYDPDGNLLYGGENKTVTVESPRLWWCRGQGEQPLYSWEAESSSGMKARGRIGFRRVRLVRNAGVRVGSGGLSMFMKPPLRRQKKRPGRALFHHRSGDYIPRPMTFL